MGNSDHFAPGRWVRRTLLLPALIIALVGCSQSTATSASPEVLADSETRYSYRTATRDGIGKVSFGREISEVMGHLGAGWLEREERQRQEATDKLIDALPLQPDSVVADIGAGTGYFTLPIAARVPDGQVVAVDIQQEMLDIIDARMQQVGFDNVETRLSEVADPKLAPSSVDVVLIVDAYHEFSHPYEMATGIAQALKPGGQLILIEYREEDPTVAIKPLHKMSEGQAKREMQAVGLQWVRTDDFLPQQHFLVFSKPF